MKSSSYKHWLAYVTGYLINHFDEIDDSLDRSAAVKELIKKASMKVLELGAATQNDGSEFCLKICRAAAFPYNKEIHALINFEKLFDFTLVDIYDIKQKGKINRKIESLDGETEYIIKNIDMIDWQSFDTFIIGHMSEINLLLHNDFKDQLLSECLDKKKTSICLMEFLRTSIFHYFRPKV